MRTERATSLTLTAFWLRRRRRRTLKAFVTALGNSYLLSFVAAKTPNGFRFRAV
jgi:hypothetical protein